MPVFDCADLPAAEHHPASADADLVNALTPVSDEDLLDLLCQVFSKETAEQDIRDGFRAQHQLPVALQVAARLGLPLFPSWIHGKPATKWRKAKGPKQPCITEFYATATTDLQQIVRWWQQWQQNFSIATGRVGGMIAFDVDGETGRRSWEILKERLQLPPSIRVISGREGGGEHDWYQIDPNGPEFMNQQGLVLKDGTRFPGVDVRAWHGHIIMPGSIHKDGKKRYECAPGAAPDEIEFSYVSEAAIELLPTKELDADGNVIQEAARGASARTTASPVGRASPVAHDLSSYLIGDGPGRGGYQASIYKFAIRYFYDAGSDAPEQPLFNSLTRILIAKNDPARTDRYLKGPDLMRQIERAREYVRGKVKVEYTGGSRVAA